MRKDYEKLFIHFEPKEPPAGLFDKIILAIKREQELRHTKRLALGLLFLLLISLGAAPFSWTLLIEKMEDSGVLYFLSTALNDLGVFFAFWQEFVLAIVESLPIVSITVFLANMVLAIFTLRLFLYKRRLLIGYLFHSF